MATITEFVSHTESIIADYFCQAVIIKSAVNSLEGAYTDRCVFSSLFYVYMGVCRSISCQ